MNCLFLRAWVISTEVEFNGLFLGDLLWRDSVSRSWNVMYVLSPIQQRHFGRLFLLAYPWPGDSLHLVNVNQLIYLQLQLMPHCPDLFFFSHWFISTPLRRVWFLTTFPQANCYNGDGCKSARKQPLWSLLCWVEQNPRVVTFLLNDCRGIDSSGHALD
jgi:hypothetical protein